MRTPLLVASLSVSFGLGFATHWGMSRHRVDLSTPEARASYYWAGVRLYQDTMANPPVNATAQHGDGLIGITLPEPDIETCLVALAELGEVQQFNVALCDVPRTSRSERAWVNFMQEHDDEIIYGLAGYERQGLDSPGTGFLMNFWTKSNGSALVQQLVEELEQISTEALID